MICGAFGELTFLYFLSRSAVSKFTVFWKISPIYQGWLDWSSFFRRLSPLLFTHCGERHHNCAQSSKSISQASIVKRHLLTHSGLWQYSCTQCNISFNQALTLKMHLLTHTGEKWHRCPQCNYSANIAGNLSHITIHNPQSTVEE